MRREIKYHYYAFMDMGGGQTMHWDGVAHYNAPILTSDDYFALKRLMSEEHAPKIFIQSLSKISDVTIED